MSTSSSAIRAQDCAPAVTIHVREPGAHPAGRLASSGRKVTPQASQSERVPPTPCDAAATGDMPLSLRDRCYANWRQTIGLRKVLLSLGALFGAVSAVTELNNAPKESRTFLNPIV